MMKRYWAINGMMALTLLALSGAQANNLRIENTTVLLSDVQDGTAKVQFDLSWENSWRHDTDATPGYFHDAAWVFFKLRPVGAAEWTHVKLNTAGTNPADCDRGTAGTAIELIVPTDRMGAFIRRSASNQGDGALASTNVTLRWHIVDSGAFSSQTIEMQVFGLEMVYVAEGPFWMGDGVPYYNYYETFSMAPTWINTSDPTVTAVQQAGSAFRYTGGRPFGQTAPTSAAWPNGYSAFYCMKYPITQGQYADFLNLLTAEQAGYRNPSNNVTPAAPARWSITNSVWPTITAGRPDRACNWLSWADGAAFAAWSALRPLTDMEYEKASRGPLPYGLSEYPWGTTTIKANASLNIVGAENGTETVADDVSLGAAIYGSKAHVGGDNPSYKWGPLRVGIFATNQSDRVSAGATYWGIMDLSGHLFERPVDIQQATGRAFIGSHGNGLLDALGNAEVADWPGTNAVGTFYNLGSWGAAETFLQASDRRYRGGAVATRQPQNGWRGGRSAQ